jgi:D-glycero-beta-D-manno-heptose-7-phosphate kinase
VSIWWKGFEMKNIEDLNILVIGDIMLDEYIIGEVDRICPEAPVPVVKIQNKKYSLGGCGNVSRNIAELGAKVTTFSAIGDDESGSIIQSLIEKIEDFNNLIVSKHMITTKKTRVVANHRLTQMLRIDEEHGVDYLSIDKLCNRIDKIKEIPDIIIVSDYNKGIITKEIMQSLKKLKIPIIVDPKPINFLIYEDVFLISPNKKEYDQLKLYNILKQPKWILTTLGSDGMKLSKKPFTTSIDIKSDQVDIYNVTGAGDTVVAILSTCISMGLNVLTSAKIANDCARYVVTRPGTSVIPRINFYDILSKYIEE